jgi:hypothetical protein
VGCSWAKAFVSRDVTKAFSRKLLLVSGIRDPRIPNVDLFLTMARKSEMEDRTALGQPSEKQMGSAKIRRCLNPIGRWRVYVESGLPRTPVEVTYWDGLLRAEHQGYFVSQHQCEWDHQNHRPRQISHLHCFEHPDQSHQQPLFDAQWIREPIEEPRLASHPPKPGINACQLPLFLGPMLVR